MGLNDSQQALVLFMSALLMMLATVAVPSDLPYASAIKIALFLAGAIGFALKEALGGKPPAVAKTLMCPEPPSEKKIQLKLIVAIVCGAAFLLWYFVLRFL